MRTVRLLAPGQVRLGTEDPPVPGPGQTLVRVTDVGLCGSDLHWFDSGGIGDARLASPLVLGHEIAGVAEDGPLRGRRVAVDPAVPCRRCPTCRRGHGNLCPTVRFAGHGSQDGGLRELMAWPTGHLHPLPDPLSTTDGAVLEPLGVAIHAADLGRLRAGSAAAVLGCGPIGLLLVQVAQAVGATSVLAVEPLPHRREAARSAGATAAVTPAQLRDGAVPPDLVDVDVAFEVAGVDAAVEQAVQVTRPGGRVVLVGIPAGDRTSFPASPVRRKGLSLVLARRMKEDAYPRGIALVQRGRVDLAGLVTHRYPLDAAAEAFAVAAARQGLKVVIQPN